MYIRLTWRSRRCLDKKPKARTVPPGIVAEDGLAITDLPIAPGTELKQILVDQEHMILHLDHSGKSEIAIIDLTTGQEVRRIRLLTKESP